MISPVLTSLLITLPLFFWFLGANLYALKLVEFSTENLAGRVRVAFIPALIASITAGAFSLVLLQAGEPPLLPILTLLFFTQLSTAATTDMATLLILRLSSIYSLPIWLLAAALGLHTLSLELTLLGIALGYGLPWLVGLLYRLARNTTGIGSGDFELLALIGAYTGPLGVITITFYSSVIGLLWGASIITWDYFQQQTTPRQLPFAPFMGLSTILYLFGF